MPIFEFIMLKLLDRLFEPINICDGSIVALLDSMGWSENIQKNFASIYIYCTKGIQIIVFTIFNRVAIEKPNTLIFPIFGPKFMEYSPGFCCVCHHKRGMNTKKDLTQIINNSELHNQAWPMGKGKASAKRICNM